MVLRMIRRIQRLGLSSWTFLLSHCFCTTVLLLFQFTQGELQRSCSKTTEEKVGDNCHLICQCRIYPPLPPPPPPPPPPRLLVSEPAESNIPPINPWWNEIGIIGMVGCASLVFLLIMVTVCYKAIKRKPLRKEENGTSQSEYAMTSRNKVMDANNTFA